MKFDRFMRVMLVLIAVLLAVNCAKDFNQFSNSRIVADNASPNSGTGETVVHASNEPSAGIQYDLVVVPDSQLAAAATLLNQKASSGWRVKSNGLF